MCLVLFPCVVSAQHHAWRPPPEADTLVNPFANAPDSILHGEQVFALHCVPCHGEKGKGDGIARASLEPRPANLSTVHLEEQTDGALFWKISTGHAPMPSFKSSLSDDQIWQVILYVRKLSQTHEKEK
jgi:mono/diheme cytochrome c family protein